jgi:tetratricopeptide (TPR) repeat protein
MAQDDADKVVEDSPSGVAQAAAGAFAATMAHDAIKSDPRLSDDARFFLREQALLAREQSSLAKLQSQNLLEQNAFELSHLRWRRFSDQMKGALEVLLAVIGLALVVAVGAAIWTAAHDDSLVIEAFSVPPGLAARGLTGQVVAAQLQDKLAVLQSFTDTARPAASYTNNWGDTIKVQIPNTGVSIGELYRYLTAALGHQTHITGEIYQTANGLSVSVRTEGVGSATVSGPEADLGKLIGQAAEKIYQQSQPYRYAMFVLLDRGEIATARTIFDGLRNERSPRDRAWAYLALGQIDFTSDPERGIVEEREAAMIAPDLALPYANIAIQELALGRDEAALVAARAADGLLEQTNALNARSRNFLLPGNKSIIARLLGDFEEARRSSESLLQLPASQINVDAARLMIVRSQYFRNDIVAARRAWNELPSMIEPRSRITRAYLSLEFAGQRDDWIWILAERQTVEKAIEDITKDPRFSQTFVRANLTRRVWPYVAIALAMTGDSSKAHALIDLTPLDCYLCLRSRGRIAAASRNWGGADYWYSRATEFAPSIPFAYTDWGSVFLEQRKPDDAIAKFAEAHARGPHFADPIEMWGEALIMKNRSDLALAKFEEANRIAPKWGRLHLKWGKALLWSGDKDGARRQFATASTLFLNPAERAEVARVMTAHG